MDPRTTSASKRKSMPPQQTTTKKELQVSKSPAEFFAENQAIAGFDNLGKSLYTTVRELVENALDACEAIHILPSIDIEIQEFNESAFNKLRTSDVALPNDLQEPSSSDKVMANSLEPQPHQVIDEALFALKSSPKKRKKSAAVDAEETLSPTKKQQKTVSTQYFLVTVSDNGCGMEHEAVPNLFGRVLSGSKYGVRQTRGKFGLGAKMALIWAKKSTGHPIHIRTAHRTDMKAVPSHVSSCVLDINIYKNEPSIIEHTRKPNAAKLVGTTVRCLIAGNWTTYKARIVQYLQQLAIITPYAALSLTFSEATGKRNMRMVYDRRSEQMPTMPQTVKHHPASVNNIIVQQLIQFTMAKSLVSFLSNELSSVPIPLAKRLVAELASVGLQESMKPSQLTPKQITRLVQLFHSVQLFRPPDASALSPLGEYNLNLGIAKVVEPDLIATFRDKPSAFEGHPFLIEAAVSLGGKNAKEGITVHRFANRIPLLFEGGADVCTRVALTKIRWTNYKIDHKRDKVGVYVSIVSTKIPFKGTSKEYIGGDATAIHDSIKKALQSCCQQLRAHLSKRNALKDAMTRKAKLTKYIPDISRSLYGVLEGMRQRRHERGDTECGAVAEIVKRLDQGDINESAIQASLSEAIHIETQNPEETTSRVEPRGRSSQRYESLYIIPLFNMSEDGSNDIHDDLFSFRPISAVPRL